MKNLLVRSITGILFVAVMLACLYFGEYSFGILFLAILLGMLYEFFNITGSLKFQPHRFIASLTGGLMFILSFLIASERINPLWFFSIFPFILITFVNELFANKKHSLQNIAISLTALIYAAVPISLSNYLVFSKFHGNYSPKLFLALLVLIWVYDSAAYLFGVSFGKRRLFERISPKKSWEGAIGGTITAVAVSALLSRYITEIDLVHWLVLGFLIVVAATLGDLTESMIKRQFGVKDSGTIFPGHGGILDRFDSLLFAIPVFVCYLEVFI
ncbi:phosphatidate cytidylyltransferase [Mangrovibacterium lignilyticum]|uniref:phosphatidate cytidylyltransferase n=1 Tax=Mangrovibacterium lignilyticum TaxID=2668052 RepID=UPI0013D388EB|nr:phosphatidate cytidylyltransferase [Mangrovibacterium lignilyticum]